MTKLKLPQSRKGPDFVAFKTASNPFFMKARGKAKGTFLLVHGLSDSPYTFGPLAEDLANNGYNSVAILLTGHGADNQKNHSYTTITSEAWQADLEQGLKYTARLFPKTPIFLSGFSTGGAVSVLFLLTHKLKESILPGPKQDPNFPLKGLVLFDPALGLDSARETVIKNRWLLHRIAPPANNSGPEDASKTVGNNPARITFATGDLSLALGTTIWKIDQSKANLKIPALTFFTSGAGDTPGEAEVISVRRSKDKLEKIFTGERKVSGNFVGQIHTQLLNREELGACGPRIKLPGHYKNARFPDLVKEVVQFADKNLP